MYYIVSMSTTDIILSVFGSVFAGIVGILTTILNQYTVLFKYKLNKVIEDQAEMKKVYEADRKAALENLQAKHEEEKNSIIAELKDFISKKKR